MIVICLVFKAENDYSATSDGLKLQCFTTATISSDSFVQSY